MYSHIKYTNIQPGLHKPEQTYEHVCEMTWSHLCFCWYLSGAQWNCLRFQLELVLHFGFAGGGSAHRSVGHNFHKSGKSNHWFQETQVWVYCWPNNLGHFSKKGHRYLSSWVWSRPPLPIFNVGWIFRGCGFQFGACSPRQHWRRGEGGGRMVAKLKSRSKVA